MNLVQIQERLKDLPTQALMAYANGQNPQVPPYLALGELNRRKQMEKQVAQPPTGTVKDNIEQQVGLMQLQKARQGQMAQQSAMQGANVPTIPQGTPEPAEQPEMAMAGGGLTSLPAGEMNFGSGGIIAFAAGGDEGEEISKKEAKAILKRMKQREGTEALDPIDTPAEVDTSIPGFEAGRRTQELIERTPRNTPPTPPTPQQIEANVARADLADQIPGQRTPAPASTGSMPGEVERNITNTMNAMPGASVAKGFQGGARGVMALLGNLPNLLRGSSGQTADAPMADADQNLGAAIMSQARERVPQAAPAGIAAVAPVSRPTSQMTPQQMERAMVNAPAGIASVAPPAQRPPVMGGQRPVAPAPAKSAAQAFQEKLLAGQGMGDLPPAFEPPKQAPIGEEYMKYLSDREQKRREDMLKVQDVEAARAKRDFFNALIAGGEATRGQKGIGALFSGTGRSLGESMTAAEERALALQEKQQQLADNDAKTKFEIANLRRAEELGNSKAVYESKVKLAELSLQRNQLQGQTANAMAQNESTERIARQNNLTQMEVARINQATAMKPGETERLMTQYADIKRTKGEAAAEEFMRTIERVKTGTRGETAQQKLNVQRQALAEKLPAYQMAMSSYVSETDPAKKAKALTKIRELEALHGIKSEEGSTTGKVIDFSKIP